MDKRKGNTPNLLTDVQRAYIAGIIDGEGSICLSRKKDPTMRQGYGYRPYLHVSNTKKELLDYLIATTGVGISYAMKMASPLHKQAHTWQVWSQQAAHILEQVMPFLLLKKQQASIIVEYAARCSQGYGRTGLPTDVAQYQVRMFDAMTVLNKRGV